MSGIMLSQDNDQLDFRDLNVQEESTVSAGLLVTDRTGRTVRFSDGLYLLAFNIQNGVADIYNVDLNNGNLSLLYSGARSITGF